MFSATLILVQCSPSCKTFNWWLSWAFLKFNDLSLVQWCQISTIILDFVSNFNIWYYVHRSNVIKASVWYRLLKVTSSSPFMLPMKVERNIDLFGELNCARISNKWVITISKLILKCYALHVFVIFCVIFCLFLF